MITPSPTELFNEPGLFWDFIRSPRSEDFEGQDFDRKEVLCEQRSQVEGLKDTITKCVSGFANYNREGGVLVLGVSDSGVIKGTRHVDEQKLNGILHVIQTLRHHWFSMLHFVIYCWRVLNCL